VISTLASFAAGFHLQSLKVTGYSLVAMMVFQMLFIGLSWPCFKREDNLKWLSPTIPEEYVKKETTETKKDK